MKVSVEVRNANPQDAEFIRQMILELAEFEKLAHEVTMTVDDIKREIFSGSSSVQVLIAEVEGRAAGFALFFKSFSTFLGRPGIYLEDLYVRPEQRGLGVGKALLREIAKLAHKNGYGRVEWSVLDWNSKAIEFYKSIGAKPMDEWTVYRLTGSELTEFANN